jgi:hypothetical protein
MHYTELIDKLVRELSYRVGIPNLKDKNHQSIISEILSEWDEIDAKYRIMKLLNEAPTDTEGPDKDYVHVGKGVYVRKGDEDKEGAQKFNKDDRGTLRPISSAEYDKLKADQGEEGEKAAADSDQNQQGDSGQSEEDLEAKKAVKTTLGPGSEYAQKEKERADKINGDSDSKNVNVEKSDIEPIESDDVPGDVAKTDSGKTLYSIGGGYYADTPGGTPKYIRTENIELINVDSILIEIKAQNQKGETITVQPISDNDIDKAVEKSKAVEFPSFSEQSEDDNVNYLIGTKTNPAQFKLTSTDDAISQLAESREDAYAGRNAGKGGAPTTAQEEVSCRLTELTLQFPELKTNELVSRVADEMEKMPIYAKKSRKQLEALAAKSSAGVKIAKYVTEEEAFDYNQNQPNGFPKSFAFTTKATKTVANFLVTKLKEAKESGDKDAIAHYENEIRKFAEHSTGATGKEGDGDTALMYMDNKGRVRIVHITNKQAYNDPKLNATKKSRVIEIKLNAVEGTDVKKLTLINDIASGDVIGMNEEATNSMKSLRNDLTLKDDVDNIPSNIVNVVYGTKMFEPSDKYKKGALNNKLVQEELKKMGVDKSTANDEQILKAIINTVGEEGSTQISDSTTGTAGKLLMKMGNLWKVVDSNFESLKSKYSKKEDIEICQMIASKKEPKTKNPIFGGKLSADEICQIRNNKALQKLSKISDDRGESMRITHNKIVSETNEADVRYFMDKEGVSEAEAREMTETQNGPHSETVVRTFMKGMHWTRSIMGDADTEMLQSVGSSFVKTKDYRECLASLTGYGGDTTTREGREGLVNHLAKNVRITPGDGSVQFVNNQTGETVLLGEDTWRTAGDGEKIAGHDGKDLQTCLESKQ